ncbi:lysozyme, partial [Bartonella ancashensis]
GPVQWALASIMVLAACRGIVFVAKRFQEKRL